MVGVELRIIDPETTLPCDDGSVGEIWLCSPCVTAGYYNKPALNARVYKVRFHLQCRRSSAAPCSSDQSGLFQVMA
jgi:acyl-CoA synthetase (AMP-forming)/AMP-acid ligase II